MKNIFISGINFFEGGPLSVYYDLLDTIVASGILNEFRVVALVHKRDLFRAYNERIELIEFPHSRKSYFIRLYYELIYFYFFSKKNNVDIWLSLHDITPNVKAARKFTYCHNPLPFLERQSIMARCDIKTYILSFIYKYVYKININSATSLIVQQDWIRDEFVKMYGERNIIVAYPNITIDEIYGDHEGVEQVSDKIIYIYPAYPRVFKNYETLFRACKICEERGQVGFEVWITIDGSENRYSRYLRKKYGNLQTVKWLGLLPREELYKKYESSDCLIFPSVLETWGLPISEYKQTNKPMILADMPYAHETLGTYDKACFFEARNEAMLADIICDGLKSKGNFTSYKRQQIKEPFVRDWNELLELMTNR